MLKTILDILKEFLQTEYLHTLTHQAVMVINLSALKTN